jgi:hypothetical protein
VLKEELAKPEVVGWLRNLDRKPWSLEIPYETGGDVRPDVPGFGRGAQSRQRICHRHSGAPRP